MEGLIKKRVVEEMKNSGLTTGEIAKRVGISSEMVTQYCTTKKLPRLDAFANDLKNGARVVDKRGKSVV